MKKRLLLSFLGIMAAVVVASAAALLPTSSNSEQPDFSKKGPVNPDKEVTVEIQAEIKANGGPATDKTFTLVLTADDGAPLPGGASGSTYEHVADGLGVTTLPEIKFNALGLYIYHLKQLPGTNTRAVYDASAYTIKVAVMRNEETGEWYAEVAIRLDSTGVKTDICTFTNTYPRATNLPGFGVVNQLGDCFE